MLPRECEYLIRWIRSVIHGTTPEELPEDLSFQKIYDLALINDVSNLMCYAVEKLDRKPEEELLSLLRTRRDMAIAKDMNQAFAREELVQALREKNIPLLELQGTVLKELYPRREYRTMSDLDFMIPLSKLEEAGQILQSLGYDIHEVEGVEIDGHRPSNIYVEIHTEYFSCDTFLHRSMGDPDFSPHRSEGEKLRELYLYNILHVAKHYFSTGCGLRRVLDVFYLQTRYGEQLQALNVQEDLRKIGLLEFAKELTDLAMDWFAHTEFRWNQGDMAQCILTSSLHGNKNNFFRSKLLELSEENSFRSGNKCRYLLSRIFPGGKIMYRNYPFLKKYPILYPPCWIHRGIKLITTGRLSRATEELKMVVEAKEDHRKRH